MRRSTLVMCALLAVATSGCERVKDVVASAKDGVGQLIARLRGQEPSPEVVTQPSPLPPSGTRPAAPAPVSRTPTPPPVGGPARPLEDMPYSSPDTGTLVPGAAERDVYALWGAPVSVRRAGEWTYLFFRNGCEYSCGTYDVVFLQNGIVVDAIVRWWGHIYGGESTSPPDVVPMPTRGDEVLQVVPFPTDTIEVAPAPGDTAADAPSPNE